MNKREDTTETPDSPAVARARAARALLAKDCNYDVDTLGRMLMKHQAESGHALFQPKDNRPRH